MSCLRYAFLILGLLILFDGGLPVISVCEAKGRVTRSFNKASGVKPSNIRAARPRIRVSSTRLTGQSLRGIRMSNLSSNAKIRQASQRLNASTRVVQGRLNKNIPRRSQYTHAPAPKLELRPGKNWTGTRSVDSQAWHARQNKLSSSLNATTRTAATSRVQGLSSKFNTKNHSLKTTFAVHVGKVNVPIKVDAKAARTLNDRVTQLKSKLSKTPLQKGGLNLYKWRKNPAETRKRMTEPKSSWSNGHYTLFLPNKGSPRANWKQNATKLRSEIRRGKPIYDSYRTKGGRQIPASGFLRAERKLLEHHGWKYDSRSGAYHPPKKD